MHEAHVSLTLGRHKPNGTPQGPSGPQRACLLLNDEYPLAFLNKLKVVEARLFKPRCDCFCRVPFSRAAPQSREWACHGPAGVGGQGSHAEEGREPACGARLERASVVRAVRGAVAAPSHARLS